MLEPRFVVDEVEVGDGINSRREEAFKHKLTDVLYFVLIITEFDHIKDFYGWAVLYDLSKQTNQRQSYLLSHTVHHAKLYVSEICANVSQSGYYLLLKWLDLLIKAVHS